MLHKNIEAKKGCELTGTGGGGVAYGGGHSFFNVLYGAFMQPACFITPPSYDVCTNFVLLNVISTLETC